MNKKLLILLALAIVAIPMASACGRTALTGQPLAQPIPHAVDVRFADCLACHAADMAEAKAPFDHVALGYTDKDCSSLPVCHKLPTGSAMTTPPTSTAVSSTPASSTPGSSTTPASSTPAGATLTTTPRAITDHNLAALKAYAGLCKMCHAPGLSNSNPYPPTWNGGASGSTVNTGIYTIVPGSPADHTNYTDDQCTQAGCHAAPTS
jgi:cytochrome c553